MLSDVSADDGHLLAIRFQDAEIGHRLIDDLGSFGRLFEEDDAGAAFDQVQGVAGVQYALNELAELFQVLLGGNRRGSEDATTSEAGKA